jgi:hypothetical protein
MRFPNHTKSIFWDFDSRDIDKKKHGNFIITRIAEKGGAPDIAWLKKNYSMIKIKKAIRLSRNVSKKTKNFWLNVI